MRTTPTKGPRKESTGSKPKRDRLITGEVTVDLMEKLSSSMTFLTQPSLKAKFVQLCQRSLPTPLNPSDVLRQLVIDYIQEHQAKVDQQVPRVAEPADR